MGAGRRSVRSSAASRSSGPQVVGDGQARGRTPSHSRVNAPVEAVSVGSSASDPVVRRIPAQRDHVLTGDALPGSVSVEIVRDRVAEDEVEAQRRRQVRSRQTGLQIADAHLPVGRRIVARSEIRLLADDAAAERVVQQVLYLDMGGLRMRTMRTWSPKLLMTPINSKNCAIAVGYVVDAVGPFSPLALNHMKWLSAVLAVEITETEVTFVPDQFGFQIAWRVQVDGAVAAGAALNASNIWRACSRVSRLGERAGLETCNVAGSKRINARSCRCRNPAGCRSPAQRCPTR